MQQRKSNTRINIFTELSEKKFRSFTWGVSDKNNGLKKAERYVVRKVKKHIEYQKKRKQRLLTCKNFYVKSLRPISRGRPRTVNETRVFPSKIDRERNPRRQFEDRPVDEPNKDVYNTWTVGREITSGGSGNNENCYRNPYMKECQRKLLY